MNNRTGLGIIIQARQGAQRLPGKMVKPFYGGIGILELILEKICNGLPNVTVIVATTTSHKDDEIVEICKSHNVVCFRGSETNVLDRFIQSARLHQIDRIVRVCADNPFIDLEGIVALIDLFEKTKFDYGAFQTSDGKPTILSHYGFWAEATTLEALQRIARHTQDRFYLEHVTNYMYQNPQEFELCFLRIPPEIEAVKNIRLTVDTMEDFILAQTIYRTQKELGISDLKTLISLISENKQWQIQMLEQIKLNTK